AQLDPGAELAHRLRIIVMVKTMDVTIDQIIHIGTVENHPAASVAIRGQMRTPDRVTKNEISRGLPNRVIRSQAIAFHPKTKVASEHVVCVHPTAPGMVDPKITVALIRPRREGISTEEIEIPFAIAK